MRKEKTERTIAENWVRQKENIILTYEFTHMTASGGTRHRSICMKRVRNLFAVVSAVVIDEWWHHYQELRAFLRLLRTNIHTASRLNASAVTIDVIRAFYFNKMDGYWRGWWDKKGENKIKCQTGRRSDEEEGRLTSSQQRHRICDVTTCESR